MRLSIPAYPVRNLIDGPDWGIDFQTLSHRAFTCIMACIMCIYLFFISCPPLALIVISWNRIDHISAR